MEKKYLEREVKYKFTKEEFTQLRINRYADYINDLYCTLVQQYITMEKALEGNPNYVTTPVYRSLSRTDALRYLLDKYQPRGNTNETTK